MSIQYNQEDIPQIKNVDSISKQSKLIYKIKCID